jgi:protein kinase A
LHTVSQKEIIKGFLTNDLTRRLGNMRGGVKDIKSHIYFKGVDWEALYDGKIPSPYVPKTNGEGDDSNFDRCVQRTGLVHPVQARDTTLQFKRTFACYSSN